MTIKDALNFGFDSLGQFERPLLESEILLSFALNKDRIYLHTNYNKKLENFYIQLYKSFIQKRKNHEPIEYITNSVSFYGYDFYISNGALIPRPESEILVYIAIDLISKHDIKNIAEIGIGSGILSIIISKLSDKQLNIHASDISPEALFNAYVNIQRFKTHNITLHKSNLLDFNKEYKFDLIISNPPYIKNDEILPKELSFEPQKALFGGNIGDEILKDIIKVSIKQQARFLLCEMGYDQKEQISNFIKGYKHKKIEFYKDLAGLDRGFLIEF